VATANETARVREYWEQASCGTDATEQPKHTLPYFEEIEAFRYRVEPYIHSFAQFTRWRGKKVLEVGVGAGTDFLQFARAGARVHGVDLTNEAIENVRHRLALYGLEAEDLRQVNAEQIPHPSNSFDLVYSWGVIHHAENMEKVFSEIYRVCKPGGTIKIMVYNYASMHTWYMWMRHAVLAGKFRGPRWAVYNYQESYATKVYTERAIRRMLAPYKHSGLTFHFWNQLVRDGARFEGIRKVLHRALPKWSRWYLAFELRKEA
jgi:ubiquinone/menaquinone biosynthesis C-methylase UbiE